VGERLAEQTAQVDEASAALQKLETENKKFLEVVQRAESALKLERERLRWPQLLTELKRHSQKRVWITTLQVMAAPEVLPAGASGGKPAAPVVEIGGMFETQSEKADAEAVANFQRALEAGGILRNVEVLERETPQYVDGKTDQVALKFRLKAEWPEETQSQATGPGGGG
jgi:Tfp pilus assembly protein PilN